MLSQPIDWVWIVFCAGLVFIMQAGFLCVESGLTRNKNAINVAIKNISDFAVAVVLFWAWGYAVMFGPSAAGWIGTEGALHTFATDTDPGRAAFFLFQAMFCATAATIVSGAVAERMRFVGYLIVTALVGGAIYPLFGHWAWGGAMAGEPGWLAALGFIDFAGSTVVHSVGGWVALAAVLILGARNGRFPAAGLPPREIPGSNLPLAMLGVLLLFFGWFGFNGGSTLAVNSSIPGILVNTTLAAVGGTLMGLLLGWRQRGYPDALSALNGLIAGLVAITAGAHAVSALDALLIGVVGAGAMVACVQLLLRYRVDDAVGAIPAHLAAGIWGTLAVALFGDLQILGTGLDRVGQFGVQALGVVTCGLWSFGIAYLLLSAYNRFHPLRVTPEQEEQGLNVSEHGARTEWIELMQAMDEQTRTGKLSVRVPVEPFTEVGQIAHRYNNVMGALERAVDQTRAIIRDLREGVVTFTHDGVLTSFNPGAENLFGLSANEAVGMPIMQLFTGASGLRKGDLEQLLEPGQRTAFRLRDAHGEQRFVEVSVSSSQIGEEALLTAMIRDVTERRRMEEQLQREKELAQVTLASIGDGVITTDAAGVVYYLNPVAERLTGWSLKEARGLTISSVYRLIEEESGDYLDNPVRTVLSRGTPMHRHEHGLLQRRQGEPVPVQDTAAPIRSRDGRIMGVVLVFHDVTVPLHLARELSHQASHDALTGLLNRREFERRLKGVLEADPMSEAHNVLCYLDLDQFKIVNDTCGHVAGDELLRQLATLLREQVRANDVLARLGGDEFGILFLNCPLQHAGRVSESIRAAIESFRFAWQGQSFAIGVSIGLVTIHATGSDFGQLLSAADAACYAAKEAGRNRIHIYHPDDDHLLENHGQMQWVARLNAALDEDRLRLFAQPIFPTNAAAGNSANHHEILVRLEEEGRLISPGSFIPAAERYGLMPRIDLWVVRNTLAWLGDCYRQQGRLDGTWCVNLSGASLSDERFRQSIRATLEALELPPGALCLEITESAAVANLSKVIHFIGEVREMGCTFALDDFGSGLSSFAYLKNLPVDYLKIDGGFIKDIEHDPIDLAMVHAIHTIGHEMGLKTIAEFVENEAILQRLRQVGVDYVQGFHLGRPLPLEAVSPVRIMPR